jgi:hypothetical protein
MSRQKSAQIILIPKQLRMDWVDVMALDPSLPPTAFKVACVIGSHFNRHSGLTFLTQQRLADAMQMSERSIWGAIRDLESRGYLIVRRRELGEIVRKKKGSDETITVKAAGGRGVANTFLPACERSQVTATNTGRRLGERCDQFWEERSQKAATKKAHEVAADCDHSGVEWSQNSASMVATDCDPTLTDTSYQYSSRENLAGHHLGAVGNRLIDLLGEAVFRSWFAQIRLISAEGPLVVLAAPKRLHRVKINERYSQQLLQAWRMERPETDEVRIDIATRGEGETATSGNDSCADRSAAAPISDDRTTTVTRLRVVPTAPQRIARSRS